MLGLSAILQNMGAKMRVKLSILLVLTLSSISLGQSPYHYRDRGAVAGGLIGALTGGAIGKNNGNTLAGAAIGTAVGALGGAAVGDSVDTDIAWQNAARQQRYTNQVSRAVTVQDAISMSHANLSDDVIATHIRANGVAYRPRPEDLITMSKSGVSDAVIRAMQTAPLATSTPKPSPVYNSRVIVREPYYVAPPCAAPPRYYRHHWHHHPHHHHHHRPSVHWGFSFSN